MGMKRGDFPTNTFGVHVAKGLSYGAMLGGVLGAESNPFFSAAVVAPVGAAVAGVHHIVKSVRAANDEIRYKKQVDYVKSTRKNRNLGQQFNDVE